MPAVGDNNLTILDIQSRLNPDSTPAIIIEQLAEKNEILQDMVVRECNSGQNHVSTIRSGQPSGTWRMLNSGVPKDKSHTKQVTDSTGLLESYSEVDKELVNLSKNPQWVRASEDAAFSESFNQTMADTLFYGNTNTDPKQFMGLAPRFTTPGLTKTTSGYNMIDGGGTTADEQTSMWLVVWGDNTVHGLYPEGADQSAGFNMQDLGEHTLVDGDGNYYQGYRSHYQWKLGFTVRDWRYVVRIPNIEVADLISTTGAANLVRLMIRAEERVEDMSSGRAAWYCNRSVRTYLRTQILEKTNVNLTFDNVGGKKVLQMNGIPVRANDALVNTEAVITSSNWAVV